MRFDSKAYGDTVAELLALAENGERLMPLAGGGCSSEEARRRLAGIKPAVLFPGGRAPEAALAGLWLYFGCHEESHRIAQDLPSVEGSFWHGILHRQEPDAGNAAYWFRRVSRHAIYPDLAEAASGIAPERFRNDTWDPFQFIEFCETVRQQQDAAGELQAREIQRAEWQLLFAYCAGAAA